MPPAEDEHVLSWIWRVAHRYGMSVNATLSALGIPGRSSSTRRVQAALEAHAELLTSRLGPTPLRLDIRSPTSGSTMLEAELDRYLTSYETGRVQAPTFGYCPACLAQTGTWSRAWMTRLPGICPTHAVFLLDRCPACQQRPFSKPSWMSVTTEPWACPNITTTAGTRPRTVRDRCGADLRTAVARPASREQLALVDRLQDAARRSACYPVNLVTAAGFETTVEEYFDAVLELVDERVGLKTLLNTDPRSPGKLLIALRVAFAVLDQDDAHQGAAVAEEHGLLAPQGHHTPIITSHHVRLRLHNRLLGAVRLASLDPHLSPTAQLTFRTASPRPRYPHPIESVPQDSVKSPWPGQVSLDWVPQLLWPDTLSRWIHERDLPGRAAASMLLAKVGSTRPWSLIALDLRLPARFAPVPVAMITRMRRDGTWDGFRKALDTMATTLEDEPPPISYSRRRWACADQALLTAAVDLTRAETGGFPPGLSPDVLAGLTWQAYTGGTLTMHPHLEPAECRSDLLHAELTCLVHAAAAHLHHLVGCPDSGILQWQPP